MTKNMDSRAARPFIFFGDDSISGSQFRYDIDTTIHNDSDKISRYRYLKKAMQFSHVGKQ